MTSAVERNQTKNSVKSQMIVLKKEFCCLKRYGGGLSGFTPQIVNAEIHKEQDLLVTSTRVLFNAFTSLEIDDSMQPTLTKST